MTGGAPYRPIGGGQADDGGGHDGDRMTVHESVDHRCA
jgi:hypothetical protein